MNFVGCFKIPQIPRTGTSLLDTFSVLYPGPRIFVRRLNPLQRIQSAYYKARRQIEYLSVTFEIQIDDQAYLTLTTRTTNICAATQKYMEGEYVKCNGQRPRLRHRCKRVKNVVMLLRLLSDKCSLGKVWIPFLSPVFYKTEFGSK